MNDSIGRKSAAYISYLLVNFWWYVSCIVGIILPVGFVIEYVWGTHSNIIFGISVPIDTELVAFKDTAAYDHLSIGGVKGMVDYSYIFQHRPEVYWIWTVFLCLIIALYLTGLYQLKRLLKTSINEAVFTKKNTRRIKIIAFLIMAGGPLQWVQQHFIYGSIGNFVGNQMFEVALPGFEFGFIFAGLLVYTLATVFDKGRQMYQELKFTV